MVTSTECIVCPHCGAKRNKQDILGNSGLINYNGHVRFMECKRCKQLFKCVMDVSIKYKTYKN